MDWRLHMQSDVLCCGESEVMFAFGVTRDRM